MMFDNVSQQEATIVSAIIAGVVALNTFFFSWLKSSFSELRHDVKDMSKLFFEVLDKHEIQDQHRHEDNLIRFEKVAVALARLGSDNGTKH